MEKIGGIRHFSGDNLVHDILPDDTAFDVFQKTKVALYENMMDIIMPILKGTYTQPYIN